MAIKIIQHKQTPKELAYHLNVVVVVNFGLIRKVFWLRSHWM